MKCGKKNFESKHSRGRVPALTRTPRGRGTNDGRTLPARVRGDRWSETTGRQQPDGRRRALDAPLRSSCSCLVSTYFSPLLPSLPSTICTRKGRNGVLNPGNFRVQVQAPGSTANGASFSTGNAKMLPLRSYTPPTNLHTLTVKRSNTTVVPVSWMVSTFTYNLKIM